MIIIPAIDIKNGLCVRLQQGQMSRETVYSDSPEKMAVQWVEKGAERIHLVDLNGAVQGKPVNVETIKKIVKSISVPVQVGGGIRNMETIEAYLDCGVHAVILGTVAYKDPAFLSSACDKFPGQIILGIDANNGRVAIEGWTEETSRSALDLAKQYEHLAIFAIIYTDIQRDGMRVGPNLAATRELARAVKLPVILSGGIADIADVERVLRLSKDGVIGLITGRALYDGSLDLSEAVELAKNESNYV